MCAGIRAGLARVSVFRRRPIAPPPTWGGPLVVPLAAAIEGRRVAAEALLRFSFVHDGPVPWLADDASASAILDAFDRVLSSVCR